MNDKSLGPAAPGTARHTPGPWRIERNGDAIEIHSRDNPYSSGPCVVAEIPTDFGENTSLADAKLIAAAPALADALEALYRNHQGSHAGDEYCEEWCGLFKAVASPALRAAGRIP